MRFHLAPLSLTLSDLERSIQVTHVFNGYISKSIQDNHRVTIDDGYEVIYEVSFGGVCFYLE